MAVKNFRIGNDLVVLWAICNRDGSPYNLANKQVRLFVMNERGRKEVVPVLTTLPDGSINNVIRWDFYGMEQRVMGLYTLSVEIFTDEDKKSIKKDYCEAFCLVGSSSLEDEDLADNISDGGELILSSSLDVIQLTIPRIEIGVNGNWIIDGIDSGVSALGGGPGLVNKIYDVLGFGKEYDPTSVIDTFNAYAINSLYGSIKDAEKDIQDAQKDIQDAQSSINTLEEDVEYLKTLGGGGSGGGSISQEQLAAIMEAIGKKADKATTLEGYGITNAYNKTYIDSTLNKYILLSASHQTIKGDITIEGNLVVKGDMASQGEGNPSLVGASGVIVGATEYRDLNGDGLIDITSLMALYTPLSSHNSLASRVSTLEGKSTSVSVSQTLTSGKEIGAITIDGVAKSLYAPSTYDWSEIANQPSITVAYGYSASNYEELKWSGRDLLLTPYRYLIADNATGSPCMTWSINKLESEFAKYLPLSGGTITGLLQISSASWANQLVLNNSGSTASGLRFHVNNELKGIVYVSDANKLLFHNGTTSNLEVIHSGNIGDYAVKYVGGSSIDAARHCIGYDNTSEGSANMPDGYGGGFISADQGHYGFQMLGVAGINKLYFRSLYNDTYLDWSEIIHSGNVGDYAASWDNSNGTNPLSHYSGVKFFTKYDSSIGDYSDLVIPTWIGNSQSGYYTSILRFNRTSGRIQAASIHNGNYHAWSDWKTIAFTDSTVASAYKLLTKDNKYMVYLSDAGNLIVGDNIATGETHIIGNRVNLRYGTSATYGLILNSSGNVLIGTTTDRGHRLSVGRSDGAANLTSTTLNNSLLFVGMSNSVDSYGTNFWTEGSGNGFIQQGRTDEEQPALYDLILQPFGRNVGIGTYNPQAKLHVVGDAIITGDIASGSDIRFKDIINNTSLDIKDIANAPLFTFKWNDREDDNTHLGTSAQYWESISPELVTGEDFKTLNYASLGVAMGISLAKKALSHEERIKVLEEKVNELETENRRLRYGN